MELEIRPPHRSEYEEAGLATAEAYRTFLADTASSNADYLDRVADVRTRARHAVVLGAFEGGRPLGTVTLELAGRVPGGHPRPPLARDEAHVRMLGVEPGSQGRGVGRLLMQGCIEEARRAGKRRLTLETTEAMAGAHRLYESMGFRRGADLLFDDGFRLRSYELAL